MSTRSSIQSEIDHKVNQLSNLQYQVLNVPRDDYMRGAELARQIENLKSEISALRSLLVYKEPIS
jgi:hypothetical protein